MHSQLLSLAEGLSAAARAIPTILAGTALTTMLVPALAQIAAPPTSLPEADRLAEQGDWYRAGPLYAEAEQQFKRIGDRSNEIYARLGRLHREAESGAYRSVRDQIAALLPDPLLAQNAALRIRALSILGTVDLNLDTAAAEHDWNELLRVAQESNDAKWQNRARGQLSLIAGLNGDMGGAGLGLFQAIQKASEIGDTSGVVHFSIWLANGMSINGMPDRALPVLDKAEATVRKTGREVPLQLQVAKVRALSTMQDPERAKQMVNVAQSALDEARRKQTPGAQGEILNLWAKLLITKGTHADAEPLVKEAQEVARAASLPREEAQAHLLASELYRATGRVPEAARQIEAALHLMNEVDEPYDLPRYVAEQAEVKAAAGALNQADQLYTQATDLIEGLLVNAPSSMVKSSMISALGDIYVGHFRLAAEKLDQPERAFSILESARGRALYDTMRYSRSTSAKPVNSTVEREIARLQRSLLHDRLSPVQTRRVLAQLDAAYDRLNPIEYERARAEMTMLRGRPVSSADIRRRLDAGEVFVEYLLDANRSYALRITRTGVTIHRLPSRREFSQAAHQYVTAIRAKQEPGASAETLYKLAVAPVITADTKSLTIVPDGPLHLVPFASLKDESGTLFASKVMIASVPSAAVYKTLKTPSRSAANRPFLGVSFSPEQRPQNTESATRGLFDLRGAQLSPLRYSREEVAEAASALGKNSITLSGPDASEAALKAQPLSLFKVIHIAAHGVSNEREPDRAALVLAPGNRTEDGLWQAREIRAIRLNADVVVLSACETGTGRLQGQEGVMTLARAFLAAGAKSVVASLWSVDDRSTATLMGMFYEHLAKGLRVRDALRQAQMQFVKTYGAKATPYHWAGFEVIGDGAQRITNETSAAD